ncbi:TetR family transcriptional regulator [Sphingomonas sp. T9W2]|uniref:TetR/AcrR family transcriptional regulator n=1 Tax=Sphingomonas sp. T9W2 TaxID=3143183 RepID=UPI0031F50159
MARPRTVDRDQLLDVAEAVMSAEGTAGLTFGGVAKVAGISKATVQSVFKTREAMIEAMLQRWIAKDQLRFEAIAGQNPDRSQRVSAHIRATAEEMDDAHRRVASLFAALAGAGDDNRLMLSWYAARLGDLSAATDAERRERIALLATEGAFFLRYFAGFKMSDERWRDIFNDLQSFAAD